MPMSDMPRMDKTAFSVVELTDATDEVVYWQQQLPEDRLRALELLRQVMYGYDPATTRLQRVFAVIERVHD